MAISWYPVLTFSAGSRIRGGDQGKRPGRRTPSEVKGRPPMGALQPHNQKKGQRPRGDGPRPKWILGANFLSQMGQKVKIFARSARDFASLNVPGK